MLEATAPAAGHDELMDERLELRFGLFRILLTVLGMGPARSGVRLQRDRVEVRMGWAFRTRFARHEISGATRSNDKYWGIGVHGWRGVWLVNGAVSGIVTLRLDPPARAWVVGAPVRLRTLHVSMQDPEGLIAALHPGSSR